MAWSVLLGTAAGAEPGLVFGNPDYFCRNGAFAGGGNYPGDKPVFKRARIAGPAGSRVHFLNDQGGTGAQAACPDARNPRCLDDAYLVPGDGVILSKTLRGFACAWYEPARGHETVGWLPLSSLQVEQAGDPAALEDWLGTWKDADDTLTLSRDARRGALRARGAAYWPSRTTPPFHVGQFRGAATPQGNVLVVDDGSQPPGLGCQVRMSLLGRLLVVSDNHQCGGLNVSFDGVYKRRAR